MTIFQIRMIAECSHVSMEIVNIMNMDFITAIALMVLLESSVKTVSPFVESSIAQKYFSTSNSY